MSRDIHLAPLLGRSTFAVVKLDTNNRLHCAKAALLMGTAQAGVVFIARTPTELSIVALETDVDAQFPEDKYAAGHTVKGESGAAMAAAAAVAIDRGWVGYVVLGTMEFSVVGVMARLAGCLADAGVSLLAQSTYDTDYIFVKQAAAVSAESAFARAEGISVVVARGDDDGAACGIDGDAKDATAEPASAQHAVTAEPASAQHAVGGGSGSVINGCLPSSANVTERE
jgi:hypothetical protein